MIRIITALALATLLAGSPALAGGSIEEPTDKKAPVTNDSGSVNPPTSVEGGQAAPVSKGAGKDAKANPNESK